MEEKIKQPLRWKGFEYHHVPKNSNWIWTVCSGGLVLIIISVLMRNFLLGVFAVIATFIIILLGVKKPRQLNFLINNQGVKIESRIYPYEEMKSFWIENNEVVFKLKKKLISEIKIPLDNTDSNLVRNNLLKILPEKKHEESLTETIVERLGF